MNIQAIAILLNDLLTTESQSLLHHVVNGRPHFDARTFKAWKAIQQVAKKDSDHAGQITILLDQLDLPERPLGFAQNVAFLHYMTIEKMLPLLIDEKRQQIDRYEQAISHAARNGKLIAKLESLRDEDRDELAELETIAADLDAQHAAEGKTPLDQTADLQNIANVAAAEAKLAEAKGEAPADAAG